MKPTQKKTKKELFNEWRDEEQGMSSVAMFILALPLLIIAFGYGFDSLRLVFIKESLLDKLTLATQAGVSVNYVAANGLVTLGAPEDGGQLDAASSRIRAYDVYTLNTATMRSTGQILTCSTPQYNVQPTPNEKCAGMVTVIGSPLTVPQTCAPLSDNHGSAINDNMYGIKYVVNENVKMSFLPIFKVKDSADLQNLTSTSLVRARDC